VIVLDIVLEALSRGDRTRDRRNAPAAAG